MAYILYCNGVPADAKHFPVIKEDMERWRPRRFFSYWRATDHAYNWMGSVIPLITGKYVERMPRQLRPNDPYDGDGFTIEIKQVGKSKKESA